MLWAAGRGIRLMAFSLLFRLCLGPRIFVRLTSTVCSLAGGLGFPPRPIDDGPGSLTVEDSLDL